ncbi:pseudouridine synthase [Pelagophyceae sp. CCMP2097]|nr:pseudouridine synthase [Pelagophyceae sp. CCMP2097]
MADTVATWTEADVGIGGFTTDTGAIDCVFRERFSDFIVHELDLDGKTVRLTDLAAPLVSDDADGTAQSSKVVDDSTLDELVVLCGGDDALRLQLRELLTAEGATTETVVLPAAADKATRKAVHQFVGKRLTALAADTVEDASGAVPGLVCVRLWKAGSKKRKHDAATEKEPRKKSTPLDRRSAWPRHRADFIRFAVYKENLDTMKAAEAIASIVHTKVGNVGYAGTKDRRAVTTQWMTLRKQQPEHLARRINSARLPGGGLLRVGDFSFVDKELKLGDLRGNHFEIILRRSKAAEGNLAAAAKAACDAINVHGFCNYFGMQRFGTGGSSNAAVGRAVLDGDFKGCCDLVLAKHARDTGGIEAAKKLYFEGEVKRAASEMPEFMKPESAILWGLAKHGDRAYLNAFQCVDKKLQLMYLHAYQSLAWNRAASARVAHFGAKPVAGDLVLPRTDSPDSQTSQLSSENATVVVVTAENVSEFSLSDIVLPLPGHAVQYPKYDGFEAFPNLDVALLSKRGLPEYSLSGAYRYVFARPGDLQWRVAKHGEDGAKLADTDRDRVDAAAAASAAPVAAPEAAAPEGDFEALILSFTLPPSSYATCCLRELTKQSMAKNFHSDKSHGLQADKSQGADKTQGRAAAGPEAPAAAEPAAGAAPEPQE